MAKWQGAFFQRLAENVKEFAACDKTLSPDDLISSAVYLDNQLHERCRERTSRQGYTHTYHLSKPNYSADLLSSSTLFNTRLSRYPVPVLLSSPSKGTIWGSASTVVSLITF